MKKLLLLILVVLNFCCSNKLRINNTNSNNPNCVYTTDQQTDLSVGNNVEFKGTIKMVIPAGGSQFRQVAIKFPKPFKVTEMEFTFCSTTNASTIFSLNNFKLPEPVNNETIVNIIATNIISGVGVNDVIICNYKIWGK